MAHFPLPLQATPIRCTSADGLTLVLNDVLFNMPMLPGIQGLVMRVMGSAGGPKVTRFTRLMMVKDKRALRAQFERFAALPELKRIIVSHHEMIGSDAAGVLAKVAATL